MPDKSVVNRDSKGRFLPNNNANPNGRPKKDACLTSLLKEMLDQEADYIGVGAVPSDKTWRQLLVKALLTKAVSGDVKAIDLVLERCEGKVPQHIGGDEESPIFRGIVEELRSLYKQRRGYR